MQTRPKKSTAQRERERKDLFLRDVDEYIDIRAREILSRHGYSMDEHAAILEIKGLVYEAIKEYTKHITLPVIPA